MKKTILFISLIAASLPMGAGPWANPMVPSWALLNSPAPARFGHKCAYDLDRETIVLFGGRDSTDYMPNDTWEFAGMNEWTEVQALGPGGRAGHGLVFDSAAHVTILFGGVNQAGEFLNDTWSWNGAEWIKLDSTGPSPRGYFVMSYDMQRQKIVLFGGGTFDTVFNDTWEWDGNQWLIRATEGPLARISAAMAYYNEYCNGNPTGRCILFGGQADFEGLALNDTWAWNGGEWEQIHTSNSPDNRIGASMAESNIYWGTVRLYGGQNTDQVDSVYEGTWMLSFNSYDTSWYGGRLANEPPGRSFADMVSSHDSFMDQSLLIGRTDGNQIFHDVWAYPVYFGYYTVGDVNNSQIFNGLDVIYSVNYFKGGPPPMIGSDCPPGYRHWYITGDVNGSCSFNGLDISYMVAYFKGSADLLPCPDCAPR